MAFLELKYGKRRGNELMKKIILIIIVTFMCLAAGCGKSESENNTVVSDELNISLKDVYKRQRCFVCDHHWGADGNVCNLYGIKFGDDFSSNDYVCNQCVTGMFDEHVEEWKRVLENKETGQ